MQSWNYVERRKIPRYEISLSATETDLATRRDYKSITRDICEQGVGLVLDDRLPQDAPVELCLEMPDTGEKICVQGKTVWVSPMGQGKYRAGIHLNAFVLKPILMTLRMIKFQLQSRYDVRT